MATDTPNTGRDSDKFMLRFPDGMRDRLKEAAKANNRTMNAEIVARLEESFAPRIALSDAQLALDTYLATLENQAAMTEMRIQMASMQLANLQSQAHQLTSKQFGHPSTLSNEDLDSLAENVKKLGELRPSIETLQRDLQNLHANRTATLANIKDLRAAIESKTSLLERAGKNRTQPS